MNETVLLGLEKLNQVSLTEAERKDVLDFFAAREADTDLLGSIDTDAVERMVWVAPMENVLREDVVKKDFSRESLQKDAPAITDGYWQVPRVAN